MQTVCFFALRIRLPPNYIQVTYFLSIFELFPSKTLQVKDLSRRKRIIKNITVAKKTYFQKMGACVSICPGRISLFPTKYGVKNKTEENKKLPPAKRWKVTFLAICISYKLFKMVSGEIL